VTPPTYKNKPPPQYIIGVDESGTGAWAGPFTVCAYMSRVEDTDYIKQIGAQDSKTLTHARRKKLCDDLAHACCIAEIIEVPGDYVEQKKAWREGVAKAVKHCLKYVDYDVLKVAVKIDGAEDFVLSGYFDRIWDLRPTFLEKGDSLIPQISAASIFAKTRRSELMAEAHERFPMYGWCSAAGKGNDGYGVPAHLAAIQKHGVCELHRRVRPLLPYFEGEHGTASSSPEEADVRDGGGAL
jgi:ribonuclease HII